MARPVCKMVYKFDELSGDAKEKALEWARETDYPWLDENKNSLDEFEKIFPVSVGRWEYGGCCWSYINFSMTCEDEISELSGLRLAKYLWNNYSDELYTRKRYSKGAKFRYSRIILEADCVLTGYYMDEVILEPIYDFLKKPDGRTFQRLMKDCLDSWVSACNKDFEAYYDNESMEDFIRANEYEFDESGRFYG
jgi:hypothetical protein